MQGETQLLGRLGLSIPHEWWPSPPMLKEIEASGFAWIQLDSPPPSVLTSARSHAIHARGVTRSLQGTSLRRVVHAPAGLMAGEPDADRMLSGALSYAAECGAAHLVYHAMALPDGPGTQDRLLAEARSLAAIAPQAERLGVKLALENLCPIWPGAETISANPLAIRGLVRRISSPAVGMCLDVGHANVVAGLRRTSLARMVEPVLDAVVLLHVHDNFGARWRSAEAGQAVDPLRLDLHLAPGKGSLDWAQVAASATSHEAPLIMEIHPPRAAPGELAAAMRAVLAAQPDSQRSRPAGILPEP